MIPTWGSLISVSLALLIVANFVFSWMMNGLLDDGAKSFAKVLVRGRVARLPEALRADYLEMWLAELPHLSPAGQLLWVVGLYLTSTKKFKPLTVVTASVGVARGHSTAVAQGDVVVTPGSADLRIEGHPPTITVDAGPAPRFTPEQIEQLKKLGPDGYRAK